MAEAICAVCGKRIAVNDGRFVDHAGGKTIQVHSGCKK
jgi:hypothetical protein